MRISNKILASVFGLAGLALPGMAHASNCTVSLNTDTLPYVAGELRDCIDNVATSAGDVITINGGLTIDIDEGPLNIGQSIQIVGAGPDTSIIDGSNNSANRIFNLNGAGGTLVDFSGFKIQNSTDSGPGGAVRVNTDNNLQATNVVFENCDSDASEGGAIYIDTGTATLTNVTITQCHSELSGGAISNDGGTLFIQDSNINGNSTEPGLSGQGGAIYSNGDSLQIINSNLNDNTADDGGGAIYISSGATTLNGVTIDNNTTSNERGGAIYSNDTTLIFNSEITNNDALRGGAGGIQLSGFMLIENSVLSGNTAGSVAGGDDGGAIHNDDELVIRNSTIVDNQVTDGDGAGIYQDSPGYIENCTIVGNQAFGTGEGGGVYANSDLNIIVNSTIFENTSESNGGGVFIEEPTQITNVTISGNTAGDQGGGIYSADALIFVNNILSGNSATNQGPDCFNESGMNAPGPNLIQNPADCTFLGEAPITGDPMLANALADNGGPTQTLALLSGSQAINAGDNGVCPATDQRGVSRPQEVNCDLGAFEFSPPEPTPTPTATPVPPVPPTPDLSGGGCSLGAAPAVGGGLLLGLLPFAAGALAALRRRMK